MGTIRERRSERLLSNSMKLSLLGGFALLSVIFSFSHEAVPEVKKALSWDPTPADATEQRDLASAPRATSMKGARSILSEVKRNEIEGLFQNLEKNPETKERTLRQLRHVLQKAFSGQEDCWSCEGVLYFDRFDRIAGTGEARKPIGLKEWLQNGDEAFNEQNLSEARKFYSSAMQVLDERSLQEDTPIDEESIERLRSRCLQLGCR